jgi:hypothetical protein
MITPMSLRNTKRKSGFAHVGLNSSPDYPAKKPFQAYDGRADGPTRKHCWKGPRRATALEAAQDYCNYINGQKMPVPITLKSHGHKRPKRSKKSAHPKRVEANKLLAEAIADESADKSGWVYCIGEKGTNRFLKVGKCAGEPMDRLIGMQTGNPRTLYIAGAYWVEDRHAEEARLHAKFIHLNHAGEWFGQDPAILGYFSAQEALAKVKVAA